MRCLLSCLPLLAAAACAAPEPEPTPLVESVVLETFFTGGEPLADWRRLGDATYEVDAVTGTLTGSGRNLPRNAFLVSAGTYRDFELQLEVKIEPGGNSGVQVRSQVDWPGQRLWGYQVEVDPSERAWSGGLYDEGRRGWLADLADNPAAREAFVVGDWNHYRIRCEGPRIRTWVNGVPGVDHVDAGEDLDLEGHLAFQVHGGERADVAFRAVTLREL